MTAVNIFTKYKQKENHFTNGLISILSLSRLGNEKLVDDFFRGTINAQTACPISQFHVLQGYAGFADASLSGEDFCFQFETKIESGCLSEEQVHRHLTFLDARNEAHKKLILLSPDASESQYVRKFTDIRPDSIKHVQWNTVYNLLKNSTIHNRVLCSIVEQYLAVIEQNVFETDIAGVIIKVQFSEGSGVKHGDYLTEFVADRWDYWNTPRCYPQLDGKGRKLIFYDTISRAITAEVEIVSVVENKEAVGYPWRNYFSPKTMRIFEPPIAVSRLCEIPGLESFQRQRGAYRNLTRLRYSLLIACNDG